MNKSLQLIKYILSDFIAALIAWGCFFIYRKISIEHTSLSLALDGINDKFYFGLVLIPIFWVFLYYASGYYNDVYRKSRLAELWYTIGISFIGVLVLFFVLVLDDYVSSYHDYYQLFIVLFSLHFALTYIPRLIITTDFIHKIQRGEVGFNTLIIGGNGKAIEIYDEIMDQDYSTGNILIGFVNVHERDNYVLSEKLDHLGKVEDIKEVIQKYDVAEVIIALEYKEHDNVERILNLLIDTNVTVKTIPGMYEIFTGKVKMNSIYGTPLIEVSHKLLPVWQENIKNFIDISFSLLALIILSPLIMCLAVGVKLSSHGPIFYRQERVGKHGKPFTIYKFRSMIVNSEPDGPELSSKNDSRITKLGLIMRKSRLDEIPNFFNVLRGDISLVGPRPERQYFIDKIVEKAPQYIQLLKVKPGITSWGQVKYGYAENVDQMIKRMRYDLIYIENMSLYVDFKIMIYTLKIIVERKGL